MIERIVSLGGHSVKVFSKSDQAVAMLSFMFDDIPAETNAADNIEAEFTLQPTEDAKEWAVLRDDEEIYRRPHLADAANFLMGEVVFHLIEHNQHYMAIHAALLSDERGGILLPGESGNGKSSLSIWMTLNGYHYHTDELVLIKQGSLKTRVFTRPFNIKHHGIKAISSLFDIDTLQPKIEQGDFITMIAHRALNPDFVTPSPNISRILFPKYDANADNTLTKISPAIAGIELMKTNVIARNLPGHGFEQLLSIVKSVPAYQLKYNHFDALPALLKGLDTA
ncbi:MAG: hypothetical protein V3V09_03965 [Arenicellales bacterium]